MKENDERKKCKIKLASVLQRETLHQREDYSHVMWWLHFDYAWSHINEKFIFLTWTSLSTVLFFYSINASSCELCEAYSDKMEKHFGRFIIFVSAPLNLPNIFINQFDLSTNTQNSSRVTSLKAMGQAKFEYAFEFLFLVHTKKISLLLSFYFHVILEHLLKPLYKQIFGSKGSLFCDWGRLNFQAFEWRGI